MAAVVVTLSLMKSPVKHEHVDFNVLRQGFKQYGHGPMVLMSILSCASKIARSTFVSDATLQACAMTSLLSMIAYQNPSIWPIFYNLYQVCAYVVDEKPTSVWMECRNWYENHKLLSPSSLAFFWCIFL